MCRFLWLWNLFQVLLFDTIIFMSGIGLCAWLDKYVHCMFYSFVLNINTDFRWLSPHVTAWEGKGTQVDMDGSSNGVRRAKDI